MQCSKCKKYYNALANPCPCTLKRSGQFGGVGKQATCKDTSQTGATRNKIEDYRHDLLVWEFIDQMAGVMAEGVKSHGETNWKQGFDNEGRDIWNHIHNHHRQYREGDRSEPHLAKMAIGLMFQDYFDRNREIDVDKFDLADAFYQRKAVIEDSCNEKKDTA